MQLIGTNDHRQFEGGKVTNLNDEEHATVQEYYSLAIS